MRIPTERVAYRGSVLTFTPRQVGQLWIPQLIIDDAVQSAFAIACGTFDEAARHAEAVGRRLVDERLAAAAQACGLDP